MGYRAFGWEMGAAVFTFEATRWGVNMEGGFN